MKEGKEEEPRVEASDVPRGLDGMPRGHLGGDVSDEGVEVGVPATCHQGRYGHQPKGGVNGTGKRGQGRDEREAYVSHPALGACKPPTAESDEA